MSLFLCPHSPQHKAGSSAPLLLKTFAHQSWWFYIASHTTKTSPSLIARQLPCDHAGRVGKLGLSERILQGTLKPRLDAWFLFFCFIALAVRNPPGKPLFQQLPCSRAPAAAPGVPALVPTLGVGCRSASALGRSTALSTCGDWSLQSTPCCCCCCCSFLIFLSVASAVSSDLNAPTAGP